MSFTSNPYIHMGVITRDSGVTFGWECDSCGCTRGDFHGSATIAKLRNEFLEHVRTSHARTEADFEGWS